MTSLADLQTEREALRAAQAKAEFEGALADGVIMGTSIKVDGNTFNPVDPARAKQFIARARDVRAQYK